MKIKKIKNSHFNKFLGKWKTEGRILKTDRNPETKIKGTDSYELILDDRFILHKANVLMGKQRSRTYEMKTNFRDCGRNSAGINGAIS